MIFSVFQRSPEPFLSIFKRQLPKKSHQDARLASAAPVRAGFVDTSQFHSLGATFAGCWLRNTPRPRLPQPGFCGQPIRGASVHANRASPASALKIKDTVVQDEGYPDKRISSDPYACVYTRCTTNRWAILPSTLINFPCSLSSVQFDSLCVSTCSFV